MSSAKNHARRSHRSEAMRRSVFGSTARKAYIKQETTRKRRSILSDWLGFWRRLRKKTD